VTSGTADAKRTGPCRHRSAIPFYLTTMMVVIFAASPAWAGTALRTTASAAQAEVGEGVQIELSAMSDDESPESPRLQVPPGFTVQGPSISSSQQISFSNGHFEHRRGVTVHWVVFGTRPGRFVLGPATVQVGGKVVQGETLSLELVPAGSAPPKPRQRGNPFDPTSPFDPFGMFPKLPGFPNLDDLDPPIPNGPPEAPAEYQVDHATDPMAFLRATITPAEAVVGQQVTLRIYAYGGRGPYDEVGSAEPSRADFLSQSIVDSSYRQPRYVLPIDGRRWTVVKLREIALFPLHAGTLSVGPMRMGFRGPGYPETTPLKGLERQSPELRVVVREPPLAGRPPGYELGDVGSFTLAAEVEPRRVEAGDAVAVTVRVEGTGSVPHHVKHTEQRGVEWLDPTVTEAITPSNSVIGGWRAFRYVVRLDEPGTLDLGEATLPYFDPRTGVYEIARTRLGTVEVLPGKATAPAASGAPAAAAPAAPHDVLEGLGQARTKLGPLPPGKRHLTDEKAYFVLLAGGPCSVLALGGLVELGRRLRRRAARRTASQAALARRAIGEARAAADRRDSASVAASVERAIYAALEDRFGLKARAVLRRDLASTLSENGVEGALVADIVAALDACDGLRFASGTEATSPAHAVEQASSIVARLARGVRGKAA